MTTIAMRAAGTGPKIERLWVHLTQPTKPPFAPSPARLLSLPHPHLATSTLKAMRSRLKASLASDAKASFFWSFDKVEFMTIELMAQRIEAGSKRGLGADEPASRGYSPARSNPCRSAIGSDPASTSPSSIFASDR